MPSRAAHVVPYMSHGFIHPGQATLNTLDNAAQAKPKKSHQKPERSARTEEDMRFDTGPRPLRNLVANRAARRPRRTGRQDRGRNDGFLNVGNEDPYPDYPPPTFLEAISTPPLSVCPSTTTLVTMSQPMVTNLQRTQLPELSTQLSSPSISSIVPQPSESPVSPRRDSDIDSDDSLEIIETGSVQAQIDNDHSLLGRRANGADSAHCPGTPRGRTKSRRPAILDSDSDDIGEVIRSPQVNTKRRLSLSPLRTLFPYQPMVPQDRTVSAHPSPSNNPYASRSSFPFLSTTSLKMSMSTSSFLKFPMTPSTPRNESFVSRKLSSFKGKERARSESLDTWEVVESEEPRTPTARRTEEPASPSLSIQGQSRGSAPSISHPVLLQPEAETDVSRNNPSTHPLSLRDRKVLPVPRVNKAARHSAPPPPIQPVPHSVATPTPPISQVPVMSNVHTRMANSSPAPKAKKKAQVVCASPLGVNRWEADDEANIPIPSVFQRALATPLPSTPVESPHTQYADVLPVTIPTYQATVISSNKSRSPSQSPPSPSTTLSSTTTPPRASPLIPPPVERRSSADSDVHNARHYPGRPLPRPPGPSRTLVDSTYAGHEDFQVNGKTFSEGLLIDFNDTSLTEPFTSRASTPQPSERRYGTPIQISTAPSTSSASSMEFVESVRKVSLPSQRDATNSPPPAARSSASAQFLEVTDFDVLVSRLHEEQQNGSDHEALLMLSEFIGPASPVRTATRPHSVSAYAGGNGVETNVNIPLLGDVEVERRRKTKDGRIKLKLVLLDSPVDKCGICLMQFRGNNAARLGSVCRHAFHDKCLSRWLVRSNTCPMCRVPFAN